MTTIQHTLPFFSDTIEERLSQLQESEDIYLISDNPNLPWDNRCELSDLNPPKTIQLDLETTGLDPYNDRIICVQVGYDDKAFVIDTPPDFDFSSLKWLENHTAIGHNIKFDLLFLLYENIQIKKVWDTFLAEQILTNGQSIKCGLGHVAKRYTGANLDKDTIPILLRYGLRHKSVIEYSGKDVLYLENVAKQQVTKLKSRKSFKAAMEEMQTVPPLAYMEYCGFYLNQEEWLKAGQVSLDLKESLVNDLHKTIIKYDPSYRDPQLDLFSPEEKSTVKWSSPKQVSEAFQSLGIVTEPGVSRPKIEHIDHELVKAYLGYTAQNKLYGTYGPKFLRHVKDDGRIRTNFKQLVSTGRTSSSPNLQNIPSFGEEERDVYRHAFQAEEGNVLIVADYSGQESVILADRSKEPNLLEFYQSGGADLHSYVARLVWPEELAGLDLADIKKNHPDRRQTAKSTTFALAYGASPKSVGEEVYERFMDAFPGLFDYFDLCENRTLENGYITINDKTGMKFYIEDWDYFLDLRRKMDQSWWAEYRQARGTHRFKKYEKMKDDFYKIGGSIRRKSMNYPIQGTAAHQKKKAIRDIFGFLGNQNLIPTVKLCVEVHDELVIECPHEMADKLAPEVQRLMEGAANHYLEVLTMKASPVITKHWRH